MVGALPLSALEALVELSDDPTAEPVAEGLAGAAESAVPPPGAAHPAPSAASTTPIAIDDAARRMSSSR
jgi:hypothetical protein